MDSGKNAIGNTTGKQTIRTDSKGHISCIAMLIIWAQHVGKLACEPVFYGSVRNARQALIAMSDPPE